MKHSKTHGLMAGLLGLALWPAGCSTDEGRWERLSADGQTAYQAGRYAEAEEPLLAALQEAERFGEQDPRLATSLSNLAELYRAQGNYAEAKLLLQRSLAIRENGLAKALENYAALLRGADRETEAEKMEARARAIRAKYFRENPPK